MAKTYFRSYIRKINGKLIFCVQGQSDNPKTNRNRHIECYRLFENDMALCRNLYINNYTNGYFCIYPGEKFSYYRGGDRLYAYTEEWGTDYKRNIGCYNSATKKDIDLICSLYPDFIYTYKKMIKANKWATLYQIWEALQIWKEHKEIEFFFACGLFAHCYTKNIYKLSKEKQFALCKYCYAHKNEISMRDISYRELQTLMKYNITDSNEINEFINFLRDKPKYQTLEFLNYLKRQEEKTGENVSYLCSMYKDYFRMASELENDMTDPYHKFPSDLKKRHDKVLEQLNNIRKAKEKKEREEKTAKYIKAVEKFLSLNEKDFEGYSIFIPKSIDEIARQAETLRQCLIRCDYVSSVIKHRCILVFIQSTEGEPLATAEISSTGKIMQFRGLANCEVDEEKTVIFHKWLDTHPISFEKAA